MHVDANVFHGWPPTCGLRPRLLLWGHVLTTLVRANRFIPSIGPSLDIVRATRATPDVGFGAPTPLAINDDTAGDWDPALSQDGPTLYFVSERPGGRE